MSSSILGRLAHVVSHTSNRKPKVVVTRDLGPEIMPLLQNRPDIEVSTVMFEIFGMTQENLRQMVLWTQDTACSRDWLLLNAKGATALIILVTDEAGSFPLLSG